MYGLAKITTVPDGKHKPKPRVVAILITHADNATR